MSALKIAQQNLSLRSIGSVLAIIVFLLIMGGIASLFHHPAVLGGMGISFINTIVFATLMTLWFIKQTVSHSGVKIETIEKKATVAFIIFHIISLSTIALGFGFYKPFMTIDMVIGYSGAIITLLFVSFISKL